MHKIVDLSEKREYKRCMMNTKVALSWYAEPARRLSRRFCHIRFCQEKQGINGFMVQDAEKGEV